MHYGMCVSMGGGGGGPGPLGPPPRSAPDYIHAQILYCRYQNIFLFPLEEFWKDHLVEVHAKCVGQSLVVAGDQSPGNSAKYCTYTLMDTTSNLIVSSETVARNEVNLVYKFNSSVCTMLIMYQNLNH